MKTILITGANGGIGLAIVKLFLAKEFRVIAHYHKNKSHLNSINHPDLVLLQADLSNPHEATALIINAFKIIPWTHPSFPLVIYVCRKIPECSS